MASDEFMLGRSLYVATFLSCELNESGFLFLVERDTVLNIL